MQRVPRDGAFPLSYTLDSGGPFANGVACAAAFDAVLGGDPAPLADFPIKGARLLLPRSSAIEDLDAPVEKAFAESLRKLSKAGAVVTELAVPAFDRQSEYFKGGGFAGAEAYYIHRRWLDRLGRSDPRAGRCVRRWRGSSRPGYCR